jgi:hypothetical protein
MSDLPFPSAVSEVWPRGSSTTGLSTAGPMPFGGGLTGLPTVNNPNLPLNRGPGLGNPPPPIPQPPRTPFPQLRQPIGASNSVISNNYALPSLNPMPMALVRNSLNSIFD